MSGPATDEKETEEKAKLKRKKPVMMMMMMMSVMKQWKVNRSIQVDAVDHPHLYIFCI